MVGFCHGGNMLATHDDDDDQGGDYLAPKHGETAELVKSSSGG